METKRAQIKSVLRRLWMMSKERSEALKRDNYSCCRCHVKKSSKKGFEQKVEVHHKDGIDNWDEIIQLIRDKLLINIDFLETLCPDCHKEN